MKAFRTFWALASLGVLPLYSYDGVFSVDDSGRAERLHEKIPAIL
jgi:hypothetical protein